MVSVFRLNTNIDDRQFFITPVLKLVALIPSVIVDYEWKDIALCHNQYMSQLASIDEVKNEFL